MFPFSSFKPDCKTFREIILLLVELVHGHHEGKSISVESAHGLRLPGCELYHTCRRLWKFIIFLGVAENGSPLHRLNFFSTIICHDFTA